MKRLVYGLLAGLVVFGSMQAKTYTNKTFLMPRSHNENMAMEYTGWHKQFRKKNVDRWDGAIQATGFYQASTNKKNLGQYFGKYNSASGPNITNPYANDIQDFIWVKERPALSPSPLNNERALLLDPRFLIHDPFYTVRPAGSLMDVMARMRPKQESYGIIFDWHQKLDKVTKGLYFKLSAPLVHVKNKMNLCYTGTTNQNVQGTSNKVSLANYLSGCYALTGTQCALTHAKMCGSDSKTGVADIDLTLGYNFLYKERKHVGVNVALTIPTSGTPNGEHLFEAVLGYAGHWAIGMGLDSAFELWEQGKKSLEFVCAVNYKYVFNKTEKRTLGLKYANDLVTSINSPDNALEASVSGKRIPMAHYMLGGENGKAGLFPLANVLTRDVGVEPGSRVEALASFAYNWGNFTFDLGYNLFAKEGESVAVKCWPSETYGIADWDYDPDFNFGSSDIFDPIAGENGRRFIERSDLIERDAATPVYITHKIFGGITYVWDFNYPLMFGAGASWEFVQGSNSALDGYALWLKLGVTF